MARGNNQGAARQKGSRMRKVLYDVVGFPNAAKFFSMTCDITKDYEIDLIVVPAGCGDEFSFVVKVKIESMGVYNGMAEADLRRSGRMMRDLTFNVYGSTKHESLRGQNASAVLDIEFNPHTNRGQMEVRTIK